MSRLLAAGDPGGALHAQNRTMALSLALTAPFFVAFIMIPEFIMRGVFVRGRFTARGRRRLGRGAFGLWIRHHRHRAHAFGGGELSGAWRHAGRR